MPRGKNVKNVKGDVRDKIIIAWGVHLDWSARRLHDYLQAHFKEYRLRIDEIPGVRAISYIKQRNPEKFKEVASCKLEKPWSVLKFGDIQPQALPLVMKLAVAFKQRAGYPITIREAKWASRLSSLYQAKNEYSLFKLFQLVQEYAWLERMQAIEHDADYGSAIVASDDSELYYELSGKTDNEPVFNIDGNETPSEAMQKIQRGSQEERLRELAGKKAKGGESK